MWTKVESKGVVVVEEVLVVEGVVQVEHTHLESPAFGSGADLARWA